MENPTKFVQQLSQEQSERVKFCERMKHHYKEEMLKLKKRANEAIIGLMITLSIFVGFNILQCQPSLHYDIWLGFIPMMFICLIGVASLCLDTYYIVILIVEEIDWLLERDEALSKDMDILARNIQNSMEMYQVLSDFGGGSTVLTEVRILPYVLDHGEGLSLIALLKKLGKEPLAGSNYRVTYKLLVVLLSSFGMLFFIGLAAYSHYVTLGNENWEDSSFEMFKPT
ncbi:hypothetical protein AQUCO_02900005v1 [Aquilegia coerulea]|uniref:Uncharacterized protein n=1 Tax=Aquilegia coerulea TaxID=218851 RepID=A0A2G5D2W7_AQUCA|nr:hypothetical protein AQUCO_02900005v1 [Aquilegia coerulea]